MKNFMIVLRKELLNLFRNGGGIIAALVLPMVMFPLIFTIVFAIEDQTTAEANFPVVGLVERTPEGDIPLTATSNPALRSFMIDEVLSFDEKIKVSDVNNPPESLLLNKINIIINITSLEPITIHNPTSGLNETRNNYLFSVIYDDVNVSSTKYLTSVITAIQLYSQSELQYRLDFMELDQMVITPSLILPLTFSAAFPNFPREGVSNPIVSMLIPTILIGFITLGGSFVAAEVFTMEKEKNTLEGLLTTSAKRNSIFLPKFLLICLFSLFGAILQILSLVVTVLINGDKFAGAGISFAPSSGALILLNLVALCLTSSAISTFIYTRAKSNKTASALTSLMTLVPVILSYTTIYINVANIDIGSAFIPFYNSLLFVRAATVGYSNHLALGISALVNLAIGGIAFFGAYKTFNSERIILKE